MKIVILEPVWPTDVYPMNDEWQTLPLHGATPPIYCAPDHPACSVGNGEGGDCQMKGGGVAQRWWDWKGCRKDWEGV